MKKKIIIALILSLIAAGFYLDRGTTDGGAGATNSSDK